MTSPASRLYPFTSQFGNGVQVMLDPWSRNILALDAQQTVPATYNAALASNGEPPTMFATGDLPAFTASGIDPSNLLLVPAWCRHGLASEPDVSRALSIVEEFHNDPDARIGDLVLEGQVNHIGRFRDWLAGKWTNPSHTSTDPAAAAAANDDLFASVFGQIEAAHQAKLDKVAAANPPLPRTADEWNAKFGRAQR